MITYSFSGANALAVESGKKTMTIRANNRRRHAWPGETLHLVSAHDRFRNIKPRLLRAATCASVVTAMLDIRRRVLVCATINDEELDPAELAISDGFKSVADMGKNFCLWHKHLVRDGDLLFEGSVITWR
jgi:hypothetical protein